MTYTAKHLRLAFLEIARREWKTPIRSYHDQDRITQYWDACGWGRWLRNQPGCKNGYVRQQGSGVDYCGIFLGFCGLHVGEALENGVCLPVRLRPAIASVILASTQRITERGRWADPRVAMSPIEPVHVRSVSPGDIITVATSGRFVGGDHYAIVEDVQPGFVTTIEGNASGQLGDGTTGHGVIFRTRPLDSIRRVYRFTEEHFEQ